MKTKTNVIIPLALVTNDNLSVTAKPVYFVLKTFQKGKTAAHLNPSVVVTHAEIVSKANLKKYSNESTQSAKNKWVD